MSKLFPNYIIDLENGTVFSLYSNRLIATNAYSKNGYHGCEVYDIYKNVYKSIHEIIIAEGLQLPKHLWPTEENGRRYIVDHIIPVRNGGTDTFKNLHLIPKPDNNRNPISRKNQSISQIGKKLSEETKKKISDTKKGENHPMFGKHHSEETKMKISEANSGEKNYMFGKHLSEETKKKLSEIMKKIRHDKMQ